MTASLKCATMHVTVDVWQKMLSLHDVMLYEMTLCYGDHTAFCLKELSLTFKLLVIEKIPHSYD